MSNALVLKQVNQLAETFGIPESDDLISVLKATAFKGNVSDAQMSALLIVAQQYRLNPWCKEIYAFPDQNNGIVPVVGIDGWSRIVNSHPQFDGMDFHSDDDTCTCTIYRKDRSHPVKITEYLSECKRPVKPWQSHPKRMLRHKAMIQCARLAFGYGGIFDQDEAERIMETTAPVAKNMGAAEVVAPEVPAELIAAASAAAVAGVASYQQFWKEAGKDARQLLSSHHEEFKSYAVQADKDRTIEQPAEPMQSDAEFVAGMDAAAT